MPLRERLHSKGWTSAEIEHALWHLRAEEQHKHPFVQFTESSTYWIFLFGIVVVSASVTRYLFAFLLELPSALQPLSLMVVGVLGGVFGILFAHVLRDIDRLEHRHHALALLVAASASVILAYAWLGALLYGAVYAVMFAVPYAFYWWRP